LKEAFYLSLQPEIPIQPPVSSQTATTLLHHQQDQPTSSASITADQMLENPQHPDLAERVFFIVFTFQSGFSCNYVCCGLSKFSQGKKLIFRA
jgi:hypothetical protein